MNAQAFYLIFYFIFPVLTKASAPSSSTVQTSETPQLQVLYSQSGSAPQGVDWIHESHWLWTPSYEYNLVATPTLRVLLETPFDFKPLHLDVDVKIINEEIVSTKGKILKKTLIDIPFYYKQTSLKIKTPTSSAAKIYIQLASATERSLTLIHSSCHSLGISFHKKSLANLNDELTNIAITCGLIEQTLAINIQHQVGFLTSTTQNVNTLQVGKFRGILSLKLEGKEKPADNKLTNFHILGKRKTAILEYDVYTNGKLFPKHKIILGGALEYINYNEKDTSQFDSALIKLFFLGNYNFQTRPYLIDSMASISPASVYSSKGDQTRAVFSEFDLVISKKFFAQNKNWFTAGVGWYYWGMQVNIAGWGVDHFSGPRLAFTYSADESNQREFFLSLKYSPIFHSTKLDLSSYLIDLTGLYELTEPGKSKPTFLYLRPQIIQYDPLSSYRKINSFGCSLGLAATF